MIITRTGETGKAAPAPNPPAGCPKCRCRTWGFDFVFFWFVSLPPAPFKPPHCDLQPRPALPARRALFLRSFHSFTKECLGTLLPPTGSALFFKTAGCMGFLPILEWDYRDGRSPRICARVAPCVLLAFSRKDRARRQPSRKFDARAEQHLRGGRRRPPASSSQREAELPGNRERREDGG